MFYLKKLIMSLSFFLLVLITFSTFAQEKIVNRLTKQGVWKNQQIEYVDRQIAIKIKT